MSQDNVLNSPNNLNPESPAGKVADPEATSSVTKPEAPDKPANLLPGLVGLIVIVGAIYLISQINQIMTMDRGEPMVSSHIEAVPVNAKYASTISLMHPELVKDYWSASKEPLLPKLKLYKPPLLTEKEISEYLAAIKAKTNAVIEPNSPSLKPWQPSRESSQSANGPDEEQVANYLNRIRKRAYALANDGG